MAIRSSSGAASKASLGARCSPIRLGASSPRIRLQNVMQIVTTRNDNGPAQSAVMCSLLTSQDFSTPARVSAP